MNGLGRNWRFVLWNATGVTIPTGVVVRWRGWKLTNSGALEFQSAGQTATTGSTIANNAGVGLTAVDNSTDLFFGAHGQVEVPTVTGTLNGALSLWLQTSTDGGSTWPDLPDLNRGHILLAAVDYVNATNPAARDAAFSA